MHIRKRRLTPQGRWRMVGPSAIDPSPVGGPPSSTGDTTEVQTMRHLRALAATALAVMIATPVAAGSPSTVYVALGDSLAWGDGASDPASTSYTALLSDYFAAEPHGGAKQYLNLAVRGETTSSYLLAGQAAAAIAAISDPTTDTRTVTLSLGGNDLLDLLNEPTDPCVVNPVSATCQGLVASAMSTVAANYPAIMASLSTALGDDPGTEKVFVLTLYNPFGGTGSSFEGVVDVGLLGADLTIDCAANLSNPMLVGLNDLVACISAAFGAIVIDGYTVVGDNALALTHIGDPGFNIHPNDDGYAAIAKAHRGADRGR
jgi:lysophospholipase L1-like esterase